MADFEKEFAELLSEGISDVVEEGNNNVFDDDLSDETFKGGVENTFLQTPMGKAEDIIAQGVKTDVDLVVCIDVTESMKPIIDTVKGMTLSLYDDVVAELAKKKRKVRDFRVKVIAFRDYYCDGEYAMAESQFYKLPEETSAFSEFVLGLNADGGGDVPENALEAIALAMKSDWVHAVSANEKARNIIVVFTDADAHPLEKAQDGVTKYYPVDMLTSLSDLKDAWEGQKKLAATSVADMYRMDPAAKRLIIYSPQDSYPWNEMSTLKGVKMVSIEPAKGGKELDRETLLNDIAGSIRN